MKHFKSKFYIATMGNIIKFNYEGQAISFEFSDGSKMINATEMVKAFPNKRINDFLSSKQTKDFVAVLEARNGNSRIGHESNSEAVLRVVKGGTPELQGTWVNDRLALKLAAWLSPEFEVWVYDRIEELIRTGKTELPQKIDSNLSVVHSLRLIADFIEEQTQFNEGIRDEVDFVKDRLGEIEAKITSIDESHYTISGYCALVGRSVPNNEALTFGRMAAKESRAKGYDIGKAYDAKYGEINTYHIEILKGIIE